MRDRVNNRPGDLHRWLVYQYALESPARLHDRDIADDGAPDHTPEAKAYIGLSQQDEPNDWAKLARRTDNDGFYITPARAAISRIRKPLYRHIAGSLACNLFLPLDVMHLHGIREDDAVREMVRILELVWREYSDRPIPRRSRRSDAQLDAEAAA